MKLLSILFLVLIQLPIQAREYSPELAKETFLDVWNKVDATFDAKTVSYTHLTLPTIYSV